MTAGKTANNRSLKKDTTMTTQPAMEVGSVAGPEGNAAKPTIEERFAAHANQAFPDEEVRLREEEDATPEGDIEPEDETQEGDEPDLEAVEEGEEPEAQSVKAPEGMSPEEKEVFAKLPREQQEFVSRRVGEMEKGFFAKTQALAQERQQVEAKSLAEIQTISATYAQALQQMLPGIPEKPSARLQVEDPIAWAEQQEYYDWAVGQHQQVNSLLGFATSVAQQADQEQQRRDQAATVAILQSHFPDYLDPEKSLPIRKELGAIGSELGFSAEELQFPNGRDILALRKVAEWKRKAEKLDKLNVDNMAGLRQMRNAPKLSRPGQPQAAGQAAQKRIDQYREGARNGDRDAQQRLLSRHLT